MKVRIFGIVPQEYTLDSGYSFKGNKVYAMDLDKSTDGLLGHYGIDFRIPADSALANVPLKVDGEYNVFFKRNSSEVDFISESK